MDFDCKLWKFFPSLKNLRHYQHFKRCEDEKILRGFENALRSCSVFLQSKLLKDRSLNLQAKGSNPKILRKYNSRTQLRFFLSHFSDKFF